MDPHAATAAPVAATPDAPSGRCPRRRASERHPLAREEVSVPRSLKKFCKDCGSTSRALKAPGPRCATCHRERKKAVREAAHGRWILKTYGITSEQYQALYGAQGGVCYICQRATGKVRKLAVDHDHNTGYVRGLLCKPCNSVLAHARDDGEFFERAFEYLREPPAHAIIGKVKPGGEHDG